jgi:tRNA(Ile)-lysidine synthase
MIDRLNQHLSKSGLLPQGSSIVVAVSGGVDSVALLDMLMVLKEEYGWDIAIAHLDHKVRPSSADDAQMVADMARKYDAKYYLGQLGGDETREAGLRRARYDFLEAIRSGHQANWIVTAHHRDDRIETSIFNTIRGADRYGMTAMRPVRGRIVRPLLPFRKGDLIAYAHAKGLPFVEDETNSDQSYSRNFVRHSLLPLASQYDTNFHDDYLKRLDKIEELNVSIEHGLEQIITYLDRGSKGDKLKLDRVGFAKLSPVIQLNLLVHIARQLCPGIGLSEVNLGEAQRYLLNAKTGTHKTIGGMLELRRDYDVLVLLPIQAVVDVDQAGRVVPLSPGGAIEFGRYLLALNSPSGSEVFDSAWLKPGSYYVRKWCKGDRIYPAGIQGSKKMSDLFIDKKVPQSDRLDWPIIVNTQNEIVWVPGLSIGRKFVGTPESNDYYVTCEVI